MSLHVGEDALGDGLFEGGEGVRGEVQGVAHVAVGLAEGVEFADEQKSAVVELLNVGAHEVAAVFGRKEGEGVGHKGWFYQLDDQGIAKALSNRIGESTAREASAGLWAIGNYNGQRLFYARRVTTASCSATHVDPTNALILTVRPPDITEVRWGNKILPLCEVFTLTPDMLNIQWSLLDRAAPPPKDVAPKPQTKQAKLAFRVTRWHEFFCDRIDEIQRSKAEDNVSFDKPQPRDFRVWLKTKYPHEQCVSDRSLFKDLEKLQNPNEKLFYSQEIATLLANWNDDFLYKYNRQHIHDALTKRQATLQRDHRCSYDDNIHCG